MMTKMTMMLFLTDYYVIIHSLAIFSLHFVSSFFPTNFSAHHHRCYAASIHLSVSEIFISFNRLSYILERFCPLSAFLSVVFVIAEVRLR